MSVESLVQMMISSESPLLAKNTAIDILCMSCLHPNINISFINQCFLYMDTFIATYFGIQDALQFDRERSERLLLQIQLVTLTENSDDDQQQVFRILNVAEKILIAINVHITMDPLLVVKTVLVLLENCVQRSNDKDTVRVCLSPLASRGLRSLFIQCMHGGVTQDNRRKIQIMLAQAVSSEFLVNNWILEQGNSNTSKLPASSQSSKDVSIVGKEESGRFLAFVFATLQGELRLLLEKALDFWVNSVDEDSVPQASSVSTIPIAAASDQELQQFGSILLHDIQISTAIVDHVFEVFMRSVEEGGEQNASVCAVASSAARVEEQSIMLPANDPNIMWTMPSYSAVLRIKQAMQALVGDTLEYVREVVKNFKTVSLESTVASHTETHTNDIMSSLFYVLTCCTKWIEEDDSLQESMMSYVDDLENLPKVIPSASSSQLGESVISLLSSQREIVMTNIVPYLLDLAMQTEAEALDSDDEVD